MEIEKIIKEKNPAIVDVRSEREFLIGHVPGAVNIPLNEIPQRMDEIRKLPQPLILCCASGTRSAQAEAYITQEGIECYNGGSWVNINTYCA